MKRQRVKRFAAVLASVTSVASPVANAQMPNHLNDFPTTTRAEYIFGCMQVNGNNRLALERCSCSIDVIASIITHDQYVEAETILSIRMRGGESTQPMNAPLQVAKVKELKLAQVEGELRCF
jgi:hypothetical protein